MSSTRTSTSKGRARPATASDQLGGRLPLLSPDALDDSQRQLYQAMVASVLPWASASGFEAQLDDGRFIGPFNPCLLRPKISGPFLALQAAESEHTSLSERVRQVIILTVGAVWRSEYELYAHTAVARTAGLSEEVIHVLATGGQPEDLTEQESIAHQVARQLAVAHRVESSVYDEAERVLTSAGVVDIAVLVGIYETVCGLLNIFEVPAPSE